MLLLQFEEGKPVYIPSDLYQGNLPSSYRYYDFILNFIQENIKDEKKQLFGMMKAIEDAFSQKQQSNFIDSLIADKQDGRSKLTLKKKTVLDEF